ncbi:MAG: hypothetical protein EOP84_07340, partial [Verrucomicrobiaceae bacterium]
MKAHLSRATKDSSASRPPYSCPPLRWGGGMACSRRGHTSRLFQPPGRKFLEFLTLLVAFTAAAFTPLSAQVVGPDPAYAPRLQAPVFNAKTFGARGDNTGDDTDAIRAALAACHQAGGGTVYLPAGTYRVAPKTEGGYAFPLHFGNLVIEGDGAGRTLLNFQAWGMKDPTGLILKRGGAFTTHEAPSPINGITLRGFRASGNAPPTSLAGQWWGDESLKGWDITHKALGIWGAVTNLSVEDCEWDNWRGEILYAGGGLELGKFTIRRNRISGCNASAVSMGGDVLLENNDIFNVHNATECLAMGGHQKLVVRDCVIEPNRSLPADTRIGKFGVVYLGFHDSSLTVEGCRIGETQYGGVFLSDFASNVTVRNNTFQDTVGVYSINLNMYSDQPSIPTSELGRLENLEISDNNFQASHSNPQGAILAFRDPGKNWRITRNRVRGANGFGYGSFMRSQGAWANYVLEANDILDSNPVFDSEGPRPQWVGNVVSGTTSNGTLVDCYLPSTDPAPIKLRPTWPKLRISDIGGEVMTRQSKVDPAVLPLLPSGYPLELRRLGNRDTSSGAEIQPDPTWNTLTRGYMLYRGAVLKLRKGASGLMELESYTPPDVNIRQITQTTPTRSNLQDLSFYGQREVILAPTARHTFATHSGVAMEETVTIRYNAFSTIKHVPGVIEVFNGQDFVATVSGTIQAKRRGNVLKILDPTPHSWFQQNSVPTGTLWESDLDGDGQSLLFEYAFGGKPFSSDSAPLFIDHTGGQPRLNFLWNSTASDLGYEVQGTSDLKTWRTLLIRQPGQN